MGQGALRVLDFDRWYLDTSGLKSEDLIQLWLQEEDQALADGYSGLRVSGNISFLTPEQWPAFMAYEKSALLILSRDDAQLLLLLETSVDIDSISAAASAYLTRRMQRPLRLPTAKQQPAA